MKTGFKIQKALSVFLTLLIILSSITVISTATAYAEDENLIVYETDFYEQYKDTVDAFAAGIKNFDTEIVVKDYKFPCNQDMLIKLFDVVDFMNPEFFYFESYDYSSYTQSNNRYVYSLKPHYKYDKQTVGEMTKEFEEKANWYLSKIDDNMTDFEKALILHDELILNSAYIFNYDLYIMMTEGHGVCYCYSEIYSYLLAKVGIKTEQVTSDDMNHQWTKVRIDGKWYHVDVTWDDPTPNLEGFVMHDYFLLSDSAFPGNDHYNYTSSNEVDNKYDNYSFHKSRSKLCKVYNNWYMISPSARSIVKYDYLNDTSESVVSLPYRWSTDNTIWSGIYSSFENYDGYIYYNSTEAVYAYEPLSGTTEKVCDKNCEPDYYGFRIKDGKIYGAYAERPDVSRSLELCADTLENTKVYNNPDGTAFNIQEPIARESDDTQLQNIGDSFKSIETLGIQIKKSTIQNNFNDEKRNLRFVSVLNNSIIKDADSYGYIIIGAATRDDAKALIKDATLSNTASKHIFNLKGTSNNISGDYGKFNTDKKYKYITFGVNNIGDNTVAVKFYAKKGNKVYYADHTSSSGDTLNYCYADWNMIQQSVNNG